MSTLRLATFCWSFGRYRSDGEEQQKSQNDGLLDDYSVERTADRMLRRFTATVFIPGNVGRTWRMRGRALLFLCVCVGGGGVENSFCD